MTYLSKPKKKRKSRKRLPKELAEEVLERDEHKCAICGKWEVQLHHIKYKSQGGKDELNNLVCLCLNHHNEVHSNKRYWQSLLNGYIKDLNELGIYEARQNLRRHI